MRTRHLRVLIAAAAGAVVIRLAAGGDAARIGAQQSPPTCSPVVDHLEFTQAIQEGLNPANPPIEPAYFPAVPLAGAVMPTPSVPLVDGRFIGLRAYIKEASGGAGCPDHNADGLPDLSGNLVVQIPGGTTLIARGANRRSVSDLLPPWDRRIENATLNWTFNARDPSKQDRQLIVQVCVKADIPQSSQQCVQQTITLLYRRQPDFMGVPISYIESGTGERLVPSPSAMDAGSADRALWAEWPFPTGRQGGGYHTGPGFDWNRGPITKRILGTVLLGELTEHQCLMMNAQPDYIFGWFHPDAVLEGHAGAAPEGIPAHQAYGMLLGGRMQSIYAHELGHNFGFGHGPGTIEQVGWDANNLLGGGRPRPETLNRLMKIDEFATNNSRWVNVRSDPTHGGGYENVLLRNPTDAYARFKVRGRCRDAVPGTSEPQMVVVGAIPGDAEVPGTLEPIFSQPDGRWDVTPQSTGDGVIELLDAGGAVLYSTHLPLAAGLDGGDAIVAPVPLLDDAAQVVLKRGDTIESTIARSPRAPQVTVTSPLPGTALGMHPVVHWTATDDDGDTLTGRAMFSPDGGNRWYPFGGRTAANEVQADLTDLPSSAAATIRVQVTDGFNTTTVDVGGLDSGADRPPKVVVTSPVSGTIFRVGENVPFIVSAYDPESGWVDAADIRWSSSLQGFLGTGDLNTDLLVPGTHTITASANLSPPGSGSVVVVVSP